MRLPIQSIKYKYNEKGEIIKEIIKTNTYKIEFNLGAKLRIRAMGYKERELIEECLKGERLALARFMFACIEKYEGTFEGFCKVYPNTPIMDLVYIGYCKKLLDEAIDPYHIKKPKEVEDAEEKTTTEAVEIDLRHLLTQIMSMGYTQTQALDMTDWDIECLFEAQDLKMERECNIYSTCLNYIKAFMGVKGKMVSILPKRSERDGSLSTLQEQADLMEQLERAIAEAEQAEVGEENNG